MIRHKRGALDPVVDLFVWGGRHAALRWWRWARHDLQSKDPAHADLPRIIRRIRQLESHL